MKFDYNQDGEISSIWGTANGLNRLYLNGITYNAAGQMTRLRLGNGKWESTEYNDRLQVTMIGLGNSAEDRSTLKLEYGYGSNTENNGSLRSQKITFAGLSQDYEQTYTYDDLNRLKSAEEKIGTSTNWKQSFNFDRYGNRTFDAANTTTISQSNTVTNPSASTATNRLTGYTYDAAGNLTVDAENRTFVYDAENHQTKLFGPTNNSSTPDAIYKYDGDGRRVKKISSTETTVFVYDGGGTLVAEYTAWTDSDPAPAPQVSYLTQDHLGSPRVVTNQNGAVIKRTDWMAFGEEVEFNKRTSGLGYDEVPETRKGYTGYEKDEESGLDFAQARYYNPKHGRYTSVDPLTASANVKNPQTFNRYSYVLNSPYKFSDPLGLIAKEAGIGGENGGKNFKTVEAACRYAFGMDATCVTNPTERPAPESSTNSAAEPQGGATSPGAQSQESTGDPGAPPAPSWEFYWTKKTALKSAHKETIYETVKGTATQQKIINELIKKQWKIYWPAAVAAAASVRNGTSEVETRTNSTSNSGEVTSGVELGISKEPGAKLVVGSGNSQQLGTTEQSRVTAELDRLNESDKIALNNTATAITQLKRSGVENAAWVVSEANRYVAGYAATLATEASRVTPQIPRVGPVQKLIVPVFRVNH